MGPVPLTCPLRALGQFGGPAAVVGVWLAAPARSRRMIIASISGAGGGFRAGEFLLSSDLRDLLHCAHHVLAWDGARLRRLFGGAPQAGRTARSVVAPYG
jgi:hypothetical protein